MPTINDIKSNFMTSLNECRGLFNYCLSSQEPHTNAGIEAAFLQLFRSWEVFLEEFLLCYLCGEQPLNGQSINPYFTVRDFEVARGILYQERPYCEWTNVEILIRRFTYFFALPNRVDDALRPVVVELKEITKIRNVIAHSSSIAHESFTNMWRSKIGGNPSIRRAADFLIAVDSANPPSTFFDKYANVLEVTAESIVG